MVKAVGGSISTNNINNTKSVREKTLQTSKIGLGIGAVAGAIQGYVSASGLNGKGEPKDQFISTVRKGMEKNLTPEEKTEYNKVNSFFSSVVNSQTPMKDLRAFIEDSEDLKQALPKQDNETSAQTLDRIFSNPNKLEVKDTLMDMQRRTKIDKKVSDNEAKKLILNNVDSKAKKIVKSNDTSDVMFNILEKSRKKIKINNAISNTIIFGTLGAIIGLWGGASKYNKNNQQVKK